MRKTMLGLACAVTIGALAACNGSGGRDSVRSQQTMTVAGCIAQGGDGTYVLAPEVAAGGGAVGTSGSQQQRYRLIDEANVGVARWVNREATVTGKLEKAGQETTGATTADPNGGSVSNLPSLRVAQLNGGGECTPAQ